MKSLFSKTLPPRFIGTLLLLILGVAAAAGLWTWLVVKIGNVKERAAIIGVEIAAHEAKRNAARLSSKALSARKEDLRRIERFFVNRTRPLEFIETLEDLARRTKNSIALDLLEQGDERADSLKFRLTLEGTRESVLRFLTLLEHLPYEIKTEELAFNKLSQELLRTPQAPPTRLILLISVKSRPQ